MTQTLEAIPWTRRLRSTLLLLLLVIVLGAIAAAVIAVTLVLAGSFLDKAVS